MTNESTAGEPIDHPGSTARERLRKAAAKREEAAQLIAAAEKIEAQEAQKRREHDTRDSRIVGTAVLKRAQQDAGLARMVLEGLGAASISVHDRKHLGREDGALARLQRIVDGKPPLALPESQDPAEAVAGDETPVRAPDTAWFAVPYGDKGRVPAGVRYDPESKLRFAPTRVLVEEMRALGFEERQDLAGRPFSERH